MTALVKIKSRGIILAQSVSASYVAMFGLTSIDVTGEKSLTYASETLDGGQYKTKDPNGYSDPVHIKATGWYDPLHATYTNFAPLIATPVATNFKVTWTDASTTAHVYSGVGFGLEKKATPDKGVIADIEIETSGAPS